MSLLRLLAYAAVLVIAGGSAFAQAATTNDDLVAAARALGFLEVPLKGTVQVGIVYDPGNASAAEAQTLQRLIGTGLQVGNVTLVQHLVPVTDVGHADVKVLLIPEGLGDEGGQVGEAARARHLICMTTDIGQVRAGHCLLGVRTQPKVEILVNRAVAAAAGISFAGMFRMMITEF